LNEKFKAIFGKFRLQKYEHLIFWIGIISLIISASSFRTDLSLLIAGVSSFYLGAVSVVRILKARLKKEDSNV